MKDKRYVYEGIVTEITEDTHDRFSFNLKAHNCSDDIPIILTRKKKHSQLKEGLFKVGQTVKIDTTSKADGEAIVIGV